MDITAHYQHAGEWHEFEAPPAFLYQPTAHVISMFEGRGIPVVMAIDGGFICTANMVTEVRKRNPGTMVASFKSLRAADVPFYKLLGIEPATR